MAQCGSAQEEDVAVALGLPQRTAKQLQTHFDDVLLDSRHDNWDAGWEEARVLGPVATPLLLKMLAAASSDRERSLLTAASIVSAGSDAPGVILDRALRARDPKNQTFALLALALGPRREGAPPGKLLALARGDDPAVVRIAALLLVERYQDRPRRGDPFPWPDDPGVAAAAAFAGMQLPERARLDRQWRGEHGELIWRGYYLCRFASEHGRSNGRRLAFETLATRSDTQAEARRCAAYWLGMASARSAVVAELGGIQTERGDIALLLGLHPAMRRRVSAAHAWWQPVPNQLMAAPERARLGVLHVLNATESEARDNAALWGRDSDVAGAACLALAWRFLRDGARDREWKEGMPDLPAELDEAAWLEWALGIGTDTRAKADFAKSPRLDAAWQMARLGRLPPPAACEVLERELWRRGAHPMLSLLERRRGFVRDVLLSGSRRVSGANVGKGYRPDGIETTQDWFVWADEFFKFVRVPRSGPTAELRLSHTLDRD